MYIYIVPAFKVVIHTILYCSAAFASAGRLYDNTFVSLISGSAFQLLSRGNARDSNQRLLEKERKREREKMYVWTLIRVKEINLRRWIYIHLVSKGEKNP